MGQKNLLIACQTCGYLLKDTANAYVDAGYDVTLMTSHFSWDGIKDTLNPNIKHSFVITYNRKSSIKRIITWVVCFFQMTFKIKLSYNHHKVLYVSNPPVGPLLPMVVNNEFSLLIWDIYPDVLVSQSVLKKDNLLVRWWAKKNCRIYPKSEHIYTISNGMKNCLAKYVSADKIIYIPLWPDGEMKHINKEDNLFIKEHELEDKFIVMYSGNLGNTHRMDALLDVAKEIHDSDIVFLMIGEGGKKKLIEERIEKERIQNVCLLPFQPTEMLPHSLSAADLAVVTLDSSSSQMSVPSKTFNLMAVGAPLMCIASPESELGNIVREYKVGAIFPPDSIQEMRQFVLELKYNKSKLDYYRQNALETSKHFTKLNAQMFVEK